MTCSAMSIAVLIIAVYIHNNVTVILFSPSMGKCSVAYLNIMPYAMTAMIVTTAIMVRPCVACRGGNRCKVRCVNHLFSLAAIALWVKNSFTTLSFISVS